MLFRTDGHLATSLAATGLVVVVFHPLRERLQSGVNRLMYGERDDPYGVLARLDQGLAGALAAESALAVLVEAVATALKLPYAAVRLTQGDGSLTVAEFGDIEIGKHGDMETQRQADKARSARAPLVSLPLVYHGEMLGEAGPARRAGTLGDWRRAPIGTQPAPALEDLGLVGALREHTATLDQNGLQIAVEAPVALPKLPAAAEVAAYRIVMEAVTNVVKHARNCTCRSGMMTHCA